MLEILVQFYHILYMYMLSYISCPISASHCTRVYIPRYCPNEKLSSFSPLLASSLSILSLYQSWDLGFELLDIVQEITTFPLRFLSLRQDPLHRIQPYRSAPSPPSPTRDTLSPGVFLAIISFEHNQHLTDVIDTLGWGTPAILSGGSCPHICGS